MWAGADLNRRRKEKELDIWTQQSIKRACNLTRRGCVQCHLLVCGELVARPRVPPLRCTSSELSEQLDSAKFNLGYGCCVTCIPFAGECWGEDGALFDHRTGRSARSFVNQTPKLVATATV